MRKTIAVVSLGCDKNRVDTEHMISYLTSCGHSITNDFDVAEIIIVNTCAFIESARQEAVDTILEMAQYKKQGCEKLIVTGCLPQKYAKDLYDELPEADAFLGVNDYDKIASVIENAYRNERAVVLDGRDRVLEENRVVTTPMHYAYLRIADGCNNFCTFCTIPSIRGKYRSRPMESIVAEAENLVKNGVKEIILIAQDVTRYGEDIYKKFALVDLIRELSKLNLLWIRLMYCYPELVSDELICEIAENPKVAKYIDIPMQHYDDVILKRMNRRSDARQLENVVRAIRAKSKDIAIRTTFMVGFPTENEEQFKRLCDFAEHAALENIGIFAYSMEEDTPSAKLKPQVPQQEKARRVNVLGAIHLENVRRRNAASVGSVVDVLYEDVDYERGMFVGRTQQNAPEIDALVYFTADFVDVGNMYKVRITGYDDYDLIGEKIIEPTY